MKMKRRSQKLEILLDVQTVTCTDAWIPCNGALFVSICLLGNYIRTKEVAPVFPMKLGEKYLIEKVFGDVFSLSDLDGVLDAEVLYIELIQRFTDRPETVLATFETSVRELLFPNDDKTMVFAGADLDLLMEPTAHFVGSAPPRLEISTKTTVREVRTDLPTAGSATAKAGHSRSATRLTAAVPKTTRGRPAGSGGGGGGSKAAGERPPFRWRRADPSLLGRASWRPPGERQPRRRWRSLGPPPTPGGRHCHCDCPGKAGAACSGGAGRVQARSSSVPRLDGSTGAKIGGSSVATSSSGRRPSRARSVEPLNVDAEEDVPTKPQFCVHCKKRHPMRACSVCRAYQRYFGRSYPGHYHSDCCNCECPVTVEGVRHLCGQTQRSRQRVPGYPEVGSRTASDTELAQVWADFVETSSPRKNDHRYEFYERLEDFYRRMYVRDAARRRAKYSIKPPDATS